jgi:hypothetical protein
VADKESVGAEWMSLAELQACARGEVPGRHLRGAELLQWAEYIEAGGPVYPMSLVTVEDAPVTLPVQPVVTYPAASPPPSYVELKFIVPGGATAAGGGSGGAAAAAATAATSGGDGTVAARPSGVVTSAGGLTAAP